MQYRPLLTGRFAAIPAMIIASSATTCVSNDTSEYWNSGAGDTTGVQPGADRSDSFGSGLTERRDTSAAHCAPSGDDGVCCRRGNSCDEASREECVGGGGTWLEGESCPSARCNVAGIGACCLPDCSCNRLSASEFGLGNQFDECASIGGYYLGVGSNCDTNPCRPSF